MPTLLTDGYLQFYEDDDFTDPWRPADTIWLQHGGGRNSQFWRSWVPLLGRNHRILRRDMRGHGQSGDPGEGYRFSLDDLLGDMVAFLDALELEKVHYVGESSAGMFGVAFAHRYPSRLKSLTLCAAPAVIGEANMKAFAFGYSSAMEAVDKMGPDGWAEALMQSGQLSSKDQAKSQWMAQQWGKNRMRALASYTEMSFTVDVRPLLPQLTVPTLVLAPTDSLIVPLEAQVAMRNAIPGAHIATIQGTHEIYSDNPEACTAALRQFLTHLHSDESGSPAHQES